MRVRWLAVLVSVGLIGCTADPARDQASLDDEDGDDYDGFAAKADGNNGLGGPVSFQAACTAGPRITIGAVGDVLLHQPLQQQAVTNPDHFRSLWAPVADLLARADTTYANHEGPSAKGVTSTGRTVTDPGFVFDNVVYTSYPQFNYHGSLAQDLVASGFDVVSTANNHAMDRHPIGADLTLDALDAAGLPHTGTRRNGSNESWFTQTTANGIKIAWIACSFGTNGLPDPSHQVLGCWSDEEQIKNLIVAAKYNVDAVIITPHWVGSSRVDLQACKLEYSIVSPK